MTHLLPRTLFGRLALILIVGLVMAHALTFYAIANERAKATTSLMLGFMEQDVASSVALLDRLPATERGNWLPRLARRTYSFMLGTGEKGGQPEARISKMLMESLEDAIGKRYELEAAALPGPPEHMQVHLTLSDGSPLTIDLLPRGLPMAPWLMPLLFGQLLLIGAVCWLCVRQATRPLAELARAADAMGPDLKPSRMDEGGPQEVARAATAFNAMQDRIAKYTSERMQILASVSHDLQTPITRMRLRTELMDADPDQRDIILRDLQQMEEMVREGVAYARAAHGSSEEARALDLDAFLDSLVMDYQDEGKPVTLHGSVGKALTTRPLALRRVLTNLVDNAVKYGGSAEVHVQLAGQGGIEIRVLDHGQGIPQELLETVFEPFYRVEGSRNRETGGTGLGLAIARQLAQALGATLTLQNCEGGGLEARLNMQC
jgi:signal transduction histidine kinase